MKRLWTEIIGPKVVFLASDFLIPAYLTLIPSLSIKIQHYVNNKIL